MAEIRTIQYVEIGGLGKVVPIGDLNTPVTVTLDTTAPKVHMQRVTIANGATAEILRVGTSDGDDLPSFKYLRLAPNVLMTIVFKGTNDADTSAVDIAANTVLELFTDDTRVDGAAYTDRLSGASQVITKIYAKALAAGSPSGYIDVLAAF